MHPRVPHRAAALLLSGAAVLVTACAPRLAPIEVRPVEPAHAPNVAPLASHLSAVDVLTPAAPASVGLDAALPLRLDSLVNAGLAAGAAPGAVLAVGRYGRLVHIKGYGTLDRPRVSAAPDGHTLYDLASLTKVVATTTAAMILEEEGKLDLARTVRSYVPELNAPDKAGITVRMLLTHSAGLEAYAPLYEAEAGALRGRAAYLAAINARPVRYPPGTKTVYSDWDMVLVQAVIERITGRALDAFVADRIFGPLGMRDTRFTPDTADRILRARIAPTAVDSTRGGLLRGVVHDGNAWALGGVSGHAGLFSSATDLAVFAQMLLAGGTYGGVRVVAPQTIARWTARQAPTSTRALGWDTPAPGSSAGRYMGARAFGHTGFTGTSLWVDPERGVFVVLLMNRTRAVGEGGTRYTRLRREVADAVEQAVVDAPVVELGSGR